MNSNKSLPGTFGYVIIPKNTFLFRGHKDRSPDDCMFFGLKHFIAGAFSEEIQVWKTTTDIEVLFLVEALNERSFVLSALPRLYNTIFPAEIHAGFDDLDIKHWDNNRRNKLVRKLYDDHKISGWLTSLENKIELEVCLFDRMANTNQLQLIDISHRKARSYFKDSLQDIQIFAPETFYLRTNENLGVETNRENNISYLKYLERQNACIKEEARSEEDTLVLSHFYSDLRTKMKI